MQLNPNIIRAAAVVIIGGVILLAFTYLVDFFIPLLVLAFIVFIGYLIYRFITTGGTQL